MRGIRLKAACMAVALVGCVAAAAWGGYTEDSYIDGCRTADGRFQVTAELVEGTLPRGPFKWRYVWKDNKEEKSASLNAQGVQGGQIYGQLFIAPDGETFALFNHVVMWSPGKSDDHAAGKMEKPSDDASWRKQEAFSHRLIIYRKDGSILKSFAVDDFVRPAEWESVSPVFNRVHWILDYPELNYRNTPRMQYAFYHVSPDYTVLEFRVVPPRADRRKGGRVVRVRLTDGHVLGEDEKSDDPAKIPVRPFQGPAQLPGVSKHPRALYIPSLDPLRQPGAMRDAPAKQPTVKK